MKSYGERFKNQMVQHGFTTAALASQLGLTSAAINKWFSVSDLEACHLRAVAAVLPVCWRWSAPAGAMGGALDSRRVARQDYLALLFASGERHAIALYDLKVGVILFDPDSQWRHYSKRLRAMAGLGNTTSDDGQAFLRQIVDDDVPALQRASQRAAKTGALQHQQFCFKSDLRTPCELTAVLLDKRGQGTASKASLMLLVRRAADARRFASLFSAPRTARARPRQCALESI